LKLLVDTCVFIDSFDPQSPNYADSLSLLKELHAKGIILTMPAHGWFEVQCSLQRLVKDKRFSGPEIAGQRQYPIRLLHIDKDFIEKYAFVDIPYIKAGDHIFVVVAKKEGCPLITSDERMTTVAKQSGVAVYSPKEFSGVLQTSA
jgi:predicted nucleic acid-binding protein